ncbi:GlcG/HbpS family heme-binding protein [Arthrobacter sp. G119Y2]|uniref:GlcG/HbpS family heme-binding protein n=1 Tax=Arthrobacter sp. G119Y2 TaxID=3134965 RepID=UPI0031194BFD
MSMPAVPTLSESRILAEAVLDKARELGVTMSVCVVDAAGHELLTIRGDGAAWFTPGVARAKAQTAAAMKKDTSALADLDARFPGLIPLIADQLSFQPTVLAGGVVDSAAQPLWAVGVSGALPEQDEECARAALTAARVAAVGR